MSLTEIIRRGVNEIKRTVVSGLMRLNVKPNTITVLGPFFALGALTALIVGKTGWAAGCAIFMGACDVLDGQIAKVRQATTAYGGFLDSTLDRVSDGFIFLGLVLHFAWRGEVLFVTLSFAAFMGAYLTSYARARSELHLESCTAGFWERPERLVFLILALFLNHIVQALWILAVFTNITALHRIWVTREVLEERPAFWRSWKGPFEVIGHILFWDFKRYTWQYDVYCLAMILWVVAV